MPNLQFRSSQQEVAEEQQVEEARDKGEGGDIHKRQELRFNNIPIVMPSSLIQQNFGEKISKHGFLEWDVKSKTYKEHDVKTDYGFYQFKIDSLEDIDNGTETLTNG